jgi:hypothetical protein
MEKSRVQQDAHVVVYVDWQNESAVVVCESVGSCSLSSLSSRAIIF